jgi:hypothetical protein
LRRGVPAHQGGLTHELYTPKVYKAG